MKVEVDGMPAVEHVVTTKPGDDESLFILPPDTPVGSRIQMTIVVKTAWRKRRKSATLWRCLDCPCLH